MRFVIVEARHSLPKSDKADIIIMAINATYARWRNTNQDFKNNWEAMGRAPSWGQVHHGCWEDDNICLFLHYAIHCWNEGTLQITLGAVTMSPHSYCLPCITGSNLIPLNLPRVAQ
jgi:hypothetical protein